MSEPQAQPAVYIETYGCQMNVLDSELVQNQLESLGYRFVSNVDDAGIVLLNTCSVRELSEHKVWSQLGRLGLAKQHEKPELVIGVLGCMAERANTQLHQRAPSVDVICGPSKLDQLPSLIDNAVRNKGMQVALSGHNSRRSATLDAAKDNLEALDLSRAFSPDRSTSQAYVRITRGCNKFCSFCVVPFTRGPEVHRKPESIVEEVKRLVDGGVLEVTLLGQTVNHYVWEEGGRRTSFADLLWKIHEEVPDLPRLRFITSYPRDFTDDALDVMAQAKRICKYLHIPAQSGSNRVLQKMNRGYTVEAYLELLQRARARMPDVRLAGDMIVGFPTETDAEHQASVELLKAARYKSCFIFKYSPRPGTVAIRRLEDDIPETVKKQRNLELLEVQGEVSLAHHQSQIGKTFDVLVEGKSKLRNTPHNPGEVQLGWANKQVANQGSVRLVGRTDGDEIVAFDGAESLVGSLVQVRATRATALTIFGELLTTGQAMETA